MRPRSGGSGGFDPAAAASGASRVAAALAAAAPEVPAMGAEGGVVEQQAADAAPAANGRLANRNFKPSFGQSDQGPQP